MQAKRLTRTAQAIAKSSEGATSRFWQGHWTTLVFLAKSLDGMVVMPHVENVP